MNNQKGFTLIELVVVMVILALLAAVAVPKFLDLQKQAEAASVKKVLGNVRSALSLRTARALVNGEDVATLAFDGGSPTMPMADLLSNRPETYLGAVANGTEKGAWFDDTDNHDLVYVLKNSDIVSAFQSQDGEAKLRFHIVTITDVVDGATVNVGLELQPKNPTTFDWNY